MKSSAVVVMPRGPDAWASAEALWITARGWAEAAQRRFGAAWIATPAGSWEPDRFPTSPGERRERVPFPVPVLLRTLLKDVLLWRRQSRFVLPRSGPWSGTRIELVWEHHDLFNEAGRRLADAAGALLVRYVHAPQVWEARKWGVRRPLWGRALEKAERRHLGRADLVACVSQQVRERLEAMGLEAARIVVAPMGCDAERFSPHGETARAQLEIPAAAVVVGWCGSFRPFHGLDLLIEAFAAASDERPDLRLLLVGDGPMRAALERTAVAAGVADHVTFAGVVPHAAMPDYLRAMDVAVVSSDGRGAFHYSPLKLREYAACGRPVIAPAEGELAELLECGFLTLHEPGSAAELATAIERIAGDRELRERQATAARRYAVEHWTWDAHLDAVLARAESLRAGDVCAAPS